MICDTCGQIPCVCVPIAQSHRRSWLIQYCGLPGCDVAIRVPVEQPLARPICKWCDQGISQAAKPKDWPAGMPDPTVPWPWMTDTDRERKLRLPYWKARFAIHADLYQAWRRI